MTINDGGPAFPAQPIMSYPAGVTVTAQGGMTLRDWFAGQAMQGVLAGTLTPNAIWSHNDVAETAYRVADAMLKAREVKP